MTSADSSVNGNLSFALWPAWRGASAHMHPRHLPEYEAPLGWPSAGNPWWRA
jgi:hypothetical protein